MKRTPGPRQGGSADTSSAGTTQRSIAFRAAPRSEPHASDWPAGSDDRFSIRINPHQPPLPWADEEPTPASAAQPRRGRAPRSSQPSARHATTRATTTGRSTSGAPARDRADPGALPAVRISRFTPVVTPRDGTPDPARWAVRLAEALLEVFAGLRPLTQLERWLSPAAMSQLAHGVRRRAARERPALLALHLHQNTARAAEVAAVYGWPDERRALAFRIDATGRGWVCTALTLPPPQQARPAKEPSH